MNTQGHGGGPSKRICVIIPAYNEAAGLAETLSALNRAITLLGRNPQPSVSVIVVDNCSTDRTAEIAREHGAQVVSESRRNIAAVRNAGARAAQADALVFLDADVLVPETFLQRIMQVMSHPRCAGGAVDTNYQPKRLFVRLYLQMWRGIGFLAGMAQGAAQFCRGDFFSEVGGYDETVFMGEDVDFYWRMRRRAKQRNLRCEFITDLRVTPSSRRFDQWPVWRTLVWTNPLLVLLWQKRKNAWRSWYENPPR